MHPPPPLALAAHLAVCLLQSVAVEPSFTPTNVWRSRQTHSKNPSKTKLVPRKKAQTVRNAHLQRKWHWTFHDLILQIKAVRAARLESTFDVFFPPDHAVPVLLLSLLDTAPLASEGVVTPLLTGNFYNHDRERNQRQEGICSWEWLILLNTSCCMPDTFWAVISICQTISGNDPADTKVSGCNMQESFKPPGQALLLLAPA